MHPVWKAGMGSQSTFAPGFKRGGKLSLSTASTSGAVALHFVSFAWPVGEGPGGCVGLLAWYGLSGDGNLLLRAQVEAVTTLNPPLTKKRPVWSK
jgi:hypothetical protein